MAGQRGQRARIAKLHRAFYYPLQRFLAEWYAARSHCTSKSFEAVTLEEAERSHILQTLQQTEGTVGGRGGAAARLGLPRTTLISKMRRLSINRGQGSAL